MPVCCSAASDFLIFCPVQFFAVLYQIIQSLHQAAKLYVTLTMTITSSSESIELALPIAPDSSFLLEVTLQFLNYYYNNYYNNDNYYYNNNYEIKVMHLILVGIFLMAPAQLLNYHHDQVHGG